MLIVQCTPTRRIVDNDVQEWDGYNWNVIGKEDEMTPKRPFELVEASKACSLAWAKRDAMIDAGDKIGVKAMDEVCKMLDERYRTIYQEWQILGGTSDIDNLAIPFVDYDHADFLEAEAARRDIYAGFGY